jgi:hypothetical protein
MSVCGKRKCRGVAMVETAISLPLFLVLMLATAEFGRAFMEYNSLTKSVRDAARFVANEGLYGSLGVVIITGDVQTRASNLVVYGNAAGTGTPLLPGLDTSDVTVEAPGEDDVLVRAGYDYAPIFDYLPFFDGSGITPLYHFEAVVRMRAL